MYHSYDAFRGTGSYFTGLQAGYNFKSRSPFVFGVEADIAAPNTIAGKSAISSAATGQAEYGEAMLQSGTVRGRIGYAFEKWLVYGTGGFGWTYDELSRNQISGTPIGGSATPGTSEAALLWRFGWAAGAGVEVGISPNWSAKLEYLITDFDRSGVTFPAAAQRFDSDLLTQSVRLGLNYHLNDNDAKTFLTKGPSALDTDNFSFHGQTTFTNQYAFPFHAPYRGQNSLDPNSRTRDLGRDFLCRRPPVAGRRAVDRPGDRPGVRAQQHARARRLFQRRSLQSRTPPISMRGCREHSSGKRSTSGGIAKSEAAINQFAGSQTADRLVVTVGKFSVADIFDTNKYAHDPRSDFLNWTVVDTGTFDYAAEPWGYTYGARRSGTRGCGRSAAVCSIFPSFRTISNLIRPSGSSNGSARSNTVMNCGAAG